MRRLPILAAALALAGLPACSTTSGLNLQPGQEFTYTIRNTGTVEVENLGSVPVTIVRTGGPAAGESVIAPGEIWEREARRNDAFTIVGDPDSPAQVRFRFRGVDGDAVGMEGPRPSPRRTR